MLHSGRPWARPNAEQRVCLYDVNNGVTSPASSTYTTGDPIEVQVTSQFSWLKLVSGKIAGNLATTSIGANATMRYEGSLSATTSSFFNNPSLVTSGDDL